MTLETLKYKGHEIRINSASPEFMAYQQCVKDKVVFSPDSASSFRANDQSSTFYFARTLEFVRQAVFKIEYNKLPLLQGEIIPIDTSIPAGADYDTYNVLDRNGSAKIIANYADDIPTNEVNATQYTNPIRVVASAYIYSVKDAENDSFAMSKGGLPQIMYKAESTRRSIDAQLEKLLGFGDANYKMTGLFNNPFVPLNLVAPTGTGSSTLWQDKTPDQILDDISAAIVDMVDISEDQEYPTHILLSPQIFAFLTTKYLDNVNYKKSIMQYIREDLALIPVKIQSLKKAFINNTEDGFILYNETRGGVEGIVPVRLRVQPPVTLPNGLSVNNTIWASSGGTRVYYPYSLSYNYGI